MFLKDKHLPSGAFEKLRARLVAGGDQQDRSIYTEDLSSPTVATSSLLTVAGVAVSQGHSVMTKKNTIRHSSKTCETTLSQ